MLFLIQSSRFFYKFINENSKSIQLSRFGGNQYALLKFIDITLFFI